MSRPSLPLIIFLCFSVLMIIPIFFMIYGAFVPSYVSRQLTLTYVIQAFTSPQMKSDLINTFEYGFGAGFLSVVVTTPLAWLVARTDIPGRGLLSTLAILRLSVPLIVEAFSWIFLFSPSIGLVNKFVESLFGINYPIFNIYSMWGLILAWGIGGIPFAFLVLEPAFRNVDTAHEEVSRTCGAGIFRTFFKVTVPMIIPAFLSVFVLTSLGGMENFDYPLIIGQNAHITTLATQVYSLVELDQSSLASGFSIAYIIITLAMLTLYIWITRKSFRYVTVTGSAKRQPQRLGKWRWPAFSFVIFIVIISFVLPITVVALVSLTPFYTVTGHSNPFATLTLAHYYSALKIPLFTRALVNSFELTIAAAGATTLMGVVTSYVLVKGKERGKNILYFLSHLPLGFPGVVYSIALLWTFLLIPVLSTYLYGTLWVMLIGLMIVWLPFSIRITAPAMGQIANELEEAAAISGAGWSRRFRQITLPLLKNAVLNSFTYVMFNSFRELGPIILLATSQSVVLIILLNNLYGAGTDFPTVAALSMLMIMMLGFTLVILRLIGTSRSRRQ